MRDVNVRFETTVRSTRQQFKHFVDGRAKLQEIMNRMRQVELEVEEESKKGPLISVTHSPSKMGAAVTESMMIDAVADVFLKEM